MLTPRPAIKATKIGDGKEEVEECFFEPAFFAFPFNASFSVSASVVLVLLVTTVFFSVAFAGAVSFGVGKSSLSSASTSTTSAGDAGPVTECAASCFMCAPNHFPASGAKASPLLEPSESSRPHIGLVTLQLPAAPEPGRGLQPSDSPGGLIQRYASIMSNPVAWVGCLPNPALRILHVDSQLLLPSDPPLRPVSMTKCGSKPGIATPSIRRRSCA
mmetsp:Transcript_68444/g.152780  ORF Transcript_68444/g.152780 Transcript_68444/m.152780 type:complete len:216 (+) Transcript_68444:542-1189(+)